MAKISDGLEGGFSEHLRGGRVCDGVDENGDQVCPGAVGQFDRPDSRHALGSDRRPRRLRTQAFQALEEEEDEEEEEEEEEEEDDEDKEKQEEERRGKRGMRKGWYKKFCPTIEMQGRS